MSAYLSYTFNDNESFINTFDEAPLWSAAFGLFLFKYLELQRDITVTDIGSGTGFPLLELAGRLGSSCKLYGIDPWVHANERARQKLKSYGYSNVEIIDASADNIPLDDNTVDLVISNLGINNFSDPVSVFKECNRVLKPKGKLVITSNLNGHWKEFYEVFYATLIQLGKHHLIPPLKKDEEHRGTIETVSDLFINNGFKVIRYFEESFDMQFVDGSAFLNHHFVKLGWLTTWLALFPSNEREEIFLALEQNLNTYAQSKGMLSLTVPMTYFEGVKVE
jgi:arsenite methyltransferase